MNQDKNHLDEVFKNTLYDLEAEPLNNSWENIAKKIDHHSSIDVPKNNVLNNVWYKYFGTGVFVTVIIGLCFIFRDPINDDELTSKQILTKNKLQASAAIKDSNTFKTAVSLLALPIKKSINCVKIKNEVLLPDGTIVILKKGATISYYEMPDNNITVNLKGVAFFESNNLSHPLVIVCDKSKVILQNGKMNISSVENDELYIEKGNATLNIGNKIVKIKEGEFVTIDSGLRLMKSNITQPNYMSWKTEKIVFNNTEFSEVISILEQCFAVSINANSEILNCRFTGTFEKNDLAEILGVLSITFNLSYNTQNSKYMIQGKGCR